MRIALFAHRLAETASTGIGRYVREFASALGSVAEPGDSVVLTSTPEGELPAWVPRAVEAQILPWPRRPAHAAWCLGTGPSIERSLGALEVAHLLYPFPPVRSVAPQLVTVHDLFPFDHPEWYSRSERWIYRRSIALTLRRARRVIVPSNYVARCLAADLAVDPARVAVVPHGVNGIYTDAGSQADMAATCAEFGVTPGRFALSVGAVNTRKNLVPLIRAMAALPNRDFPLLLVGPDGHGAEVADGEIARLAGRARVRRTGYLADEQAAALVRSAAALVHPSLAEGFGFVPLEAMAVGTPVIAARASSIPEVVGDAALLVDEAAEPTAWAAAMMEVIDDPGRRDSLSAAGKARAAEFNWDRSARIMLDVYRDVART